MSWFLATVYDVANREMERACLGEWRTTLLAAAEGEVLDIGAGTGANLGRFGPDASRITLLEPDPHMRRRLEPRLSLEPRPTELSSASAEALPFPDEHFDTVVATLVLCSVADVDRCLGEIRRVLRPGGKLLFIEHVAAERGSLRRRWQERVEPLWMRLFGNCHLTRNPDRAIERAGFEIAAIERESLRKALPLVRPSIRGIATAR